VQRSRGAGCPLEGFGLEPLGGWGRIVGPGVNKNLVLRFVGEFHKPFRKALGRNQPQLGVFGLPEEKFAASRDEGMDRDVEHVEQVVLQQGLPEKTVTQDEKIPSFLLLELGHLGDDIASNNGGVVPIGRC
jgi:hypothetical protein